MGINLKKFDFFLFLWWKNVVNCNVILSKFCALVQILIPKNKGRKLSKKTRNIACCTRGTTQEMQDCLGFVVSQPTRRPQGTISATEEEQSVPTECYLCHVVQFAALETVSCKKIKLDFLGIS